MRKNRICYYLITRGISIILINIIAILDSLGRYLILASLVVRGSCLAIRGSMLWHTINSQWAGLAHWRLSFNQACPGCWFWGHILEWCPSWRQRKQPLLFARYCRSWSVRRCKGWLGRGWYCCGCCCGRNCRCCCCGGRCCGGGRYCCRGWRSRKLIALISISGAGCCCCC